MQRLLSELRLALDAGTTRRIRSGHTTPFPLASLIAAVSVCAVAGPASASLEKSNAIGPIRQEGPHARWTVAQAPSPPVDPDRQGGTRLNPDFALPVAPPPPPPPSPAVVTAPPPSTPGGQSVAWPRYRVVNVSPNDVLNIRSGPDANSAIVNVIPPNGSGVRMTGSCAGSWCPVEYRGSQGWVNRRYLASE